MPLLSFEIHCKTNKEYLLRVGTITVASFPVLNSINCSTFKLEDGSIYISEKLLRGALTLITSPILRKPSYVI